MKSNQEFKWIRSGPLEYLSMPNLPPGLFAGFTGRSGGVSQKPFNSLDLAFHVGDENKAVNENWMIALSAIKGQGGGRVKSVRLLKQEHTGRIDNFCRVSQSPRKISLQSSLAVDHGEMRDATFILQKEEPCDAQFTELKDIAITVLTADCVPILIFDDDATVIAAVHAGWKGTSKRILENAIKRIEGKRSMSPKKLNVWIGPSIGQCCFDVGSDIADRFHRMLKAAGEHAARSVKGDGADPGGPTNSIFINNESGRSFIDLKKFNQLQALSAGVEPGKITVSDICTSCRSDLFFSYRKEKITGRQAAVIALY